MGGRGRVGCERGRERVWVWERDSVGRERVRESGVWESGV